MSNAVVAFGKITWEFSVTKSSNEEFKGFPNQYELLGTSAVIGDEEYSIDYTVVSDWGTGFNGSVEIRNNSDIPIEDWTLEFDFDNNIDNIWNAVIVSHAGNHYTVTNADFNSNINTNSSVSFGFTVSSGNSSKEISNVVLTDINSARKIDILSISEDGLVSEDGKYYLASNYSGVHGSLLRADEVTEFTINVYDRNQQLIYFDELEPLETWSAGNVGLILGYNRIVIKALIGRQFDEIEFVIESDTNRYFDNLTVDWSDEDGDSLPNYLEDYFKTNKDMVDTDNDGLTDFQELYVFGYNPLEQDTDGDGMTDFYEDEDEDNIVNGIEFEIGSDPLDNDSDNDQLLDGEEMEYGTSPILADTDEDGITDYEKYCLDSMNAQYHAEDGTYTANFSADTMGIEYDEAVIPSIRLTADKEGILSFDIDVVESDFLFNASMRGYIGAAYDFTTAGNMKDAELTFTYDESLLDPDMVNDSDFCPTIYYYDPDAGLLSEVEGQIWEGNTVTVHLQHFSRYILVNKADMEKLWAETLEVDDGVSLTLASHVVFVIDKSGSMPTNDRNHMRISLIQEFCNRMGANDKVGLIGFASNSYKYTDELLSDNESIEAAISAFDRAVDSGNTYMNDAVAKAVYMLENDVDDSEDVQKVIFCLTDGNTFDSLSSAYLQNLKSRNIKIYTVGMGSVSESYLKSVAGLTGGKYFYARTSSNLSEVFIDFEDEINEYDSNRDNLGDEITKLICRGRLTTITGTRVFCAGKDEADWEKVYNAILENDDLDGDGLKNGEEIEIYTYRGKQYIRLKSSPELYDSDFDGYSDYEEMKKDLTDPLKENYIINSDDFLYVGNYRNFESGKAYEDYIDGSTLVNVTETYLDVLLCGGELSLNKRMQKELLDYFVSYAEENEGELSISSALNIVDEISQAVSAWLPFCEYGYQRITIPLKIAKIRNNIKALYKVDNSKEVKNPLKKYIKELQSELKGAKESFLDGKAPKYGKVADAVGYLIGFLTVTSENIEDSYEYYDALNLMRQYDNVLSELEHCGAPNVEKAAQKVHKDMESEYEAFWTNMRHSVGNFMSFAASLAGNSYLVKCYGIRGVVATIIVMGASLVIGDSLSIRLKNSMAVECAMGMGLTVDQNISHALYTKDNTNNTIIVQYGEPYVGIISPIWKANIFSKIWCERKYLDFLNDNKLFFDDDYFLYKTDDSARFAKENITILNTIYGKYEH